MRRLDRAGEAVMAHHGQTMALLLGKPGIGRHHTDRGRGGRLLREPVRPLQAQERALGAAEAGYGSLAGRCDAMVWFWSERNS